MGGAEKSAFIEHLTNIHFCALLLANQFNFAAIKFGGSDY